MEMYICEGGICVQYDPKIINRMKRIEGQIRGLIKMMEEETDCRKVVTQMSAARSAMDRTAALIVAQNLEKCIREEQDSGDIREEIINDAVQLLIKSR